MATTDAHTLMLSERERPACGGYANRYVPLNDSELAMTTTNQSHMTRQPRLFDGNCVGGKSRSAISSIGKDGEGV